MACALGVLIVAGAEGSVLAWSPLVFIGTISYSLYLWHQRAGRILKALLPTYPLPVMIVIDTVLSLGLALGSYYVIESRSRKRRTGAPVVAGSGDSPVGPSESASPASWRRARSGAGSGRGDAARQAGRGCPVDFSGRRPEGGPPRARHGDPAEQRLSGRRLN